jgi:hypothetical protein
MSELEQRQHPDVIDAFGYRYVLVESERYIANDPAAPAVTRGPFYRQTDRQSGKDLAPGRVFMPDEYYLRGQLAIPGSMYTIEDVPSPDDKKFRAEVAERVAKTLADLKAAEEATKLAVEKLAAEAAKATKPAIVESTPTAESTPTTNATKPATVIKPKS